MSGVSSLLRALRELPETEAQVVLNDYMAAWERSVREQVAQEIEAHAGPYIKGRQDIRVGVRVWPEEAARGYTEAIDEVLDLARGVR